MLNETINEQGAINLITAAAKLAKRDSRDKAYWKECYNFLSSIESVFLCYDVDFPKDLKKAMEKGRRKKK